jgi:hypothetical protein
MFICGIRNAGSVADTEQITKAELTEKEILTLKQFASLLKLISK